MKRSFIQSAISPLFIMSLFLGLSIPPVLAGIPQVADITITSAPLAGGGTYYGVGETIVFSVDFNEDVQFSGTPNLQFRTREQLEEAGNIVQIDLNTLQFSFDIVSGFPSGLNDWDGIKVEKFQTFTLANFIESVSTNESVVEDFADVNFMDVKIDADTPTYSSLVINSFGANSVTGTDYINAEDLDDIQLVLTLTEKDTWGTNSFTITDGTNTDVLSFAESAIGEKITGTKKSTNGFFAGWNGPISVSSISFADKSGKNLASLPALPITTNIVVDTTLPVITVDDNTSAVAVTSDTIQVSVTDTNPDLGGYDYGLSADALCDETDIYSQSFTTGVSFVIDNQTNNGQYICFRATDLAGNTSYQATTNPINIDVTSPVFNSISVVSDNVTNPSYAKQDSTLTFTLTLATPDSFTGGGATTGRIEFEIGGQARTADFSASADYAAAGSYTADYALAGENGAITITNIIFFDRVGNSLDLTSFIGGEAPSPTVIVDTTAPSLGTVSVATTGNGLWAKKNEQVTYALTFDEEIIRQSLVTASTAQSASTLVTEFDLAVFGTTDQIVFAVADGDNGAMSIANADFLIQDRAGNTTNISAATINSLVIPTEIITADTTKPTVSNISIASNNLQDSTLATTNDTITVNFVTNDNLSPTVTLHSASRILNQSITSDSLGALGNAWVKRFTDGTETSEVVVPFSVQIRDEAGNVSSAFTSITSGGNVQFDRTDPLVSAVKISATSQDSSAYLGDVPTYYAKDGDQLDFSFQTCDYVDTVTTPAPTGTLFGQLVIMDDDGIGGACVTPEGNPASYRRWKKRLTNINGTEGLVDFEIEVFDEAGNGAVQVTGTTDGSSVIFDTTRPTLPTQVDDNLGGSTTAFKHRSNAQFFWSGASDPDTNSAVVSGVWKYKIRLTNPLNGGEDHRGTAINPEETTGNVFDGRTSNLPDPGQTKIPARAENSPYELRLITVDKAGNHSHGESTSLDWSHDPSYEQPYTIGIEGVVTDINGQPIEGAVVQIVPRYGEVCDTNQILCVATTDQNGFYSRVVKKNQDYTINGFKPKYYLYKAQSTVNTDDLVLNLSLTELDNHFTEQQSSTQAVMITTDGTFVDEYEVLRRTEIFVTTFSGQVSTEATVYQGQQAVRITSLSQILSITVNHPLAEIISLGSNEYLVTNVGKVQSNNGSLANYVRNPLKQFITIPTTIGNSGNYSGMSRLGSRSKNAVWTRAEVTADNQRIDAGITGKTNFYTNYNGYEIFAGYTNGRLPIKHLYRPRQVPISRGITSVLSKSDQISKNPREDQKIISYIDPTKSGVKDIRPENNIFRDTTTTDNNRHFIAVEKRDQREATKVNKFQRNRATQARSSSLSQRADSNPSYRIFPGFSSIPLQDMKLGIKQ